MAVHFQKTDGGRAEIRARAFELSRPARNLLLIIDSSKSGEAWVRLVQGAGEADLSNLLALGLVAPASAAASTAAASPGAPASAPAGRADRAAAAPSQPPSVAAPASSLLPEAAAPAPAEVPSAAVPLEDALHLLSYRELYDRLTEQARPRLGLLKGYRMVLEIEKCSGADEIRALALRFVADVREAQGDAAAREVRRLLGAPPAARV